MESKDELIPAFYRASKKPKENDFSFCATNPYAAPRTETKLSVFHVLLECIDSTAYIIIFWLAVIYLIAFI